MLPFPQPLGEVEVIEFEAEEFPWITIKLKDGTILRFKVVVTGVMKVGHDPNTGIPIYSIQTQGVIQLVKIPKELIKKPGQPRSPGPTT
jgi:hypothetical protein